MSKAPEGQLAANVDGLIGKIREIASETKARAAEIDRDRKFPADLFRAIEQAGAFRMLAPQRFGGLGMTLSDMNEVVREGARGNGSLGWLLMVGTAQSIGQGLFGEETVSRNFEQFFDIRIRGVIAPKGRAVPVAGGYRISGRWPFASGGPDPHFVSGNCFVMEQGKPRIGIDGEPEMILAMVPASEVTFYDNWNTLGMRGTDSCDVAVDDVFVRQEMTCNLHDMRTCYDTPASQLPLRVALSFPHCALALGIAQGAIDDLVELAPTKRSSMNPGAALSEDPLFLHELGRRTLRYDAAKSYLDKVADNCWQAAEQGRELTPREILIARLMANYITDECVAIVDWAFTAAGSASVYESCELARRLRDVHICTQHASCFADPYLHLGACTLGLPVNARDLF